MAAAMRRSWNLWPSYLAAGIFVGICAELSVYGAESEAPSVTVDATTAGCVPIQPLADQFWGDRYGQVKDPFGHCWSVGAPIKAG